MRRSATEEAVKHHLEETERAITGLMPGLFSGLVFAGANAEPEEGRDNGLLTAEEVTYLDRPGKTRRRRGDDRIAAKFPAGRCTDRDQLIVASARR